MKVKKMKNENISKSMKIFWQNKDINELNEINKKRSETLLNVCVWIKKEGEKPFPCKIEYLLSKLSQGFLIVNTEKNILKLNRIFGEIPDFLIANKK